MKNFYESYFTLLGLLTDPENLLTFKLEEGGYLVREAPIGLRECVIGWASLGAAQNLTEIITVSREGMLYQLFGGK